MSGNHKKLLALMFGALASAFISLGWGVILRLLGEPLVSCVKDGAAGGSGAFVVSIAVIMMFPFKDSPGAGIPPTPAPSPTGTPTT